MTGFIELEKGIFVAGQLAEEDFARLAQKGFKSVVCNRPDGEDEDQLASNEAEKLAHQNGLEFRFSPVIGFEITKDHHIEQFALDLAELEGPILFYCRTGTRCSLLWGQNALPRLGLERVLEIAGGAGFGLDRIGDILQERAENLTAGKREQIDAISMAQHAA